MKKIIKEQSLMSTFNNKKVNLYSDPENKNFIGQATIMSVDPINSKDKRNWLGNAVFEIQIRQKDPANGREAQVKLNFLCGTLPFPDTKNKKAGLYFDNGNRQVYSYNFEEALKKFCTVSKGGAAVPKADFVSTNTTPDQVMGEGKKVVRLSESDLIKIVKKVIKEQSVSNSINQKIGQIDIFDDKANTKKLGTYKVINVKKIDNNLEVTLVGDENSFKIPGGIIIVTCGSCCSITTKKQPVVIPADLNRDKLFKPMYLSPESFKKFGQYCSTAS